MNALYSREYSKIPDLDDYVVPDKPIEYSFDNNEYNDLFQKEYRNYDDTRSFNKQGKKLSKADLMPEQCRGKIQIIKVFKHSFYNLILFKEVFTTHSQSLPIIP
jgi:hypothetical protein